MWGISYWIFPLIAGCWWFGMLLGLLIHFTKDPNKATGYPSMNTRNGQTIAYISDVGAESLKPLFIAGCCVTTVFLDLAFLAERWLRHRGLLARNVTKIETVLSCLSLAFAVVGTVGLILLSIFDIRHHKKMHDTSLAMFIAGYVASAICICWEYQRLGIHHREHRILRISFWIKLAFITTEVGLGIAFGACKLRSKYDTAAVFEWVVAFFFTFYIFSFFVDLLPAAKMTHSWSRRDRPGEEETQLQMAQNDEYSRSHEALQNRPAEVARDTLDSQGTLGRNDLQRVF